MCRILKLLRKERALREENYQQAIHPIKSYLETRKRKKRSGMDLVLQLEDVDTYCRGIVNEGHDTGDINERGGCAINDKQEKERETELII